MKKSQQKRQFVLPNFRYSYLKNLKVNFDYQNKQKLDKIFHEMNFYKSFF
jgi:hypothetical protein